MRRLELKLILSLKAIGNLFCHYFFIFYFFLLVNGVAESEFKHFSELIHYMSLFFLYCSSESGTNDQVCLRKPKKLKTEEEVGTRKSDPGSIDGTL